MNIKPVDQYTSTMNEFTNDIVFRILVDEYTDNLDNGGEPYSEDNSDIQATVEARCMTTKEDEGEILQMIDKKLAVFNLGR